MARRAKKIGPLQWQDSVLYSNGEVLALRTGEMVQAELEPGSYTIDGEIFAEGHKIVFKPARPKYAKRGYYAHETLYESQIVIDTCSEYGTPLNSIIVLPPLGIATEKQLPLQGKD